MWVATVDARRKRELDHSATALPITAWAWGDRYGASA